MNFSKLSKEKRNQLILVVVMTLAVLAGIGFGLIRYQYASLARMDDKQAEIVKKLAQMKDSIKGKEHIKQAMEQAASNLAGKEVGMARGDLFAWFNDVVRKYKIGYKVEIPQISPNTPPAPCSLIPKFPYKQTSITVAGTGYYHDIGKFISDFENDYPFIRILNVNLELNPSPATGEREKLSFRLELVALVKPNS
ncbi:MAG: hypothetical protein HOP33_08890 [Verrucomicrobia bacterium]|nr:hypothetical protein [Verrucomicrobiota bacterium]